MGWPGMYDGDTAKNPDEQDVKADDAKDNDDNNDKK